MTYIMGGFIMSFGIALSGGGTRGAAHVGVLCALEEAGLLPSSVAGTSAGSIVGGLYALGMSPHEMKDKVTQLMKSGDALVDADYGGIFGSIVQFFRGKPLALTGFLKGDRLEKYLEELTQGKSIAALKMKTIITAVDLYTRKTIAYINAMDGVRPVRNVVWKTDVKLSAAMRASSAVPAIFQPKVLDGMCLVDGGVTDVVPVDLLIAAGVPDVLAVDVSENTPMKPDGNILDVCNNSLSILMACLAEYRSGGEQLLITPALPETAGVLTFGEVIRCMDAGYKAAADLMPIIKRRFKP
jgi:NTE family protein